VASAHLRPRRREFSERDAMYGDLEMLRIGVLTTTSFGRLSVIVLTTYEEDFTPARSETKQEQL